MLVAGTCTTTARTLRVLHLGKHPDAAEIENPQAAVRNLQKPEGYFFTLGFFGFLDFLPYFGGASNASWCSY